MSTRIGWSCRTAGMVGLWSALLVMSVQGEIVHFTAFLEGDCAGSGVSARGWGGFTLDTATGELNYRVDYDPSVEATFAHIHVFPDACGNAPSGPIIVNFNVAMNPIIGTATLSAQDVEEMKAGNTYSNIHTADFPDGEIAGVIYPVAKNRFISFFPDILVANSVAATQAIRVRLTSLHHPDPAPPGSPDFSAFEGQYRWVGAPSTRNDTGPNPTYDTAQLQCTPEFRTWNADTWLLHVYGKEVVPSSVYEVQFVDDTCLDLDDPDCYSDPLSIRTARWGDVVQPFAERTSGQPNFGDVSAVLEKLRGLGVIIRPRADLVGSGDTGSPSVVNHIVNMSDISVTLDAFRESPIHYSLGAPCP